MKFFIDITIVGVGTYRYGADSEAAARILANTVKMLNVDMISHIVITNARGKLLVEMA